MPHNSILTPDDTLIAFGIDHADVQSIDIHHNYGKVIIDIFLNRKLHPCPICDTKTDKVKDYHTKIIDHSVIKHIKCEIHYHARRYICPICHKSFYEHNPFCDKGSSISLPTVFNVIEDLKNPAETFSSIAKKHNLSDSSIRNIFDKHIDISRRPLPACICFDEIYYTASKHDKNVGPYACVLVDYIDKKVIDILPNRTKKDLIEYFSQIPLDERQNVKYVCFDMWSTYRIVAKLMFPNCHCILDRFHVIQELSRLVTKVRLRIMRHHENTIKKYQKMIDDGKKEDKYFKLEPNEFDEFLHAQQMYYLFKKFNWLFFKNDKELADLTNPNHKKQFNRKLNRYLNLYDIYMLMIKDHPDLDEALFLKELIDDFYNKSSFENAYSQLSDIISQFKNSNVDEMRPFANTLTNWKSEIINSLIVIPEANKRMNNSIIENRNKSIKDIKRNANGYRNFDRFRKRVLLCLNKDISPKL